VVEILVGLESGAAAVVSSTVSIATTVTASIPVAVSAAVAVGPAPRGLSGVSGGGGVYNTVLIGLSCELRDQT